MAVIFDKVVDVGTAILSAYAGTGLHPDFGSGMRCGRMAGSRQMRRGWLDLHGCGVDGWTAAVAAGLPMFPGLVRYDEVAKLSKIRASDFEVVKFE